MLTFRDRVPHSILFPTVSNATDSLASVDVAEGGLSFIGIGGSNSEHVSSPSCDYGYQIFIISFVRKAGDGHR